MVLLFQKLFLLLALLLLAATAVSGDHSLNCVDIGPCKNCEKTELEGDICSETGRKMKQMCSTDKNVNFEMYRPCSTLKSDEQFQVIMFQVTMAVVGGLAYWGVQIRKQSQMTLFEYRKQRSPAMRL